MDKGREGLQALTEIDHPCLRLGVLFLGKVEDASSPILSTPAICPAGIDGFLSRGRCEPRAKALLGGIYAMKETRRLVRTLACAAAVATACGSQEAYRNDGGGETPRASGAG